MAFTGVALLFFYLTALYPMRGTDIPLNSYNCYWTREIPALQIKRAVCCNITPCTPLKVRTDFGGTHRLSFQGRELEVMKLLFTFLSPVSRNFIPVRSNISPQHPVL
jgi:hypothetical protein